MRIMVTKMETTRMENTMETTMIENTKETAIMENRMETTTTMENTIEIIVMENTNETTIMGLGQAAQDCCASSRTKSRQRVLTWLPCYQGRHDTQRLNYLLGIISTSAQGDLKEPSSWEASHHPPPHTSDPN